MLSYLQHGTTPDLGQTKLMKLLYYLDFDHDERHGTSATGDVYRKQLDGPAPEQAGAVLAELEREGQVQRERASQ